MLILAAILAFLIYGMIAAMLGTILPEFSGRFQLTPRQNGTIASMQAFGLILASVGAGPLIDTEGTKAGLVLGFALSAAPLFLLPRATGFRSIVLYLFLLGLGGGVIDTGANVLASDIGGWGRATTLNFLNLFFGVGGFATPFIAANLLKRNSKRLIYLIAAFTTAALAIQVFVKMPEHAGGAGFTFSNAGAVLGKPPLLVLSLMLFLYVGCEVGVWNWLVRHLVAQGVAESRALNILSMGFALGLLSGRAVVSQILRIAPAEEVTLVASILMTITTLWMLHAKATVGIAVFLAGFAMAPVFPTAIAMIADRFPVMSATAEGIAISAGWVGLAVSSRAIGSIAGGEPKRLKQALLLIPAASAAMVILDLALGAMR